MVCVQQLQRMLQTNLIHMRALRFSFPRCVLNVESCFVCQLYNFIHLEHQIIKTTNSTYIPFPSTYVSHSKKNKKKVFKIKQ